MFCVNSQRQQNVCVLLVAAAPVCLKPDDVSTVVRSYGDAPFIPHG